MYRIGAQGWLPKVRSKVEMDEWLEELIHYGPKWEALSTFHCSEKVNLEAAGPTVRPFGNFRKFSLQLEGNKETNCHPTSALLSSSSSHTSWQQAHSTVHQPHRAEVLGIGRKHPPHPTQDLITGQGSCSQCFRDSNNHRQCATGGDMELAHQGS